MKTKILVGTQSNVQAELDVLAKDVQTVRVSAIAVDGGSIVAAVEVDQVPDELVGAFVVVSSKDDGSPMYACGLRSEYVTDKQLAAIFVRKEAANMLVEELNGDKPNDLAFQVMNYHV